MDIPAWFSVGAIHELPLQQLDCHLEPAERSILLPLLQGTLIASIHFLSNTSKQLEFLFNIFF